jgi:hypothetical protein
VCVVGFVASLKARVIIPLPLHPRLPLLCFSASGGRRDLSLATQVEKTGATVGPRISKEQNAAPDRQVARLTHLIRMIYFEAACSSRSTSEWGCAEGDHVRIERSTLSGGFLWDEQACAPFFPSFAKRRFEQNAGQRVGPCSLRG